ncbi:MAG: hypothetical protein D6693_11495, partial [Planctomycetota bacterium]
ITCRHTEPGAPARRALKRYCRVFILEQLGPRSVTRFGREKGRAMRAAMRRLDEILSAPADALDDVYTRVFCECLATLPRAAAASA